MRALDVYLDDAFVGSIAETRKGGRFAADEVKRLAVECLEYLREGVRVARDAYPGAASRHEGPSLARVARLMLS